MTTSWHIIDLDKDGTQHIKGKDIYSFVELVDGTVLTPTISWITGWLKRVQRKNSSQQLWSEPRFLPGKINSLTGTWGC